MHDNYSTSSLLTAVAAITAFIAGVVGTSLVLAAIYARQNRLDWETLESIGGFWNGHLGLMTSLLVAFGVYLQGRQLRVLIDQQKHLICEVLQNQLRDVGERIRGLQIEENEGNSESPRIRRLRGVGQIREALLRQHTQEISEVEVIIDLRVLAEFARLDSHRKEILGTLIDNNTDTILEISRDPVTEYFNDLMAGLNIVKQGLQRKGLTRNDLDCLNSLVDAGWEFNVSKVMNRWYGTATIRELRLGKQETILSEDCASEPEAYTQLASKWRQKYG